MPGYGEVPYGEEPYGTGLDSIRLEWDTPGSKLFETGIDRGVLYPPTGYGVPWNGLVGVSENPTGGEVEELYFDGVKYLDFVANEGFSATVEAYHAPRAFDICEGRKAIAPGVFATNQPRKPFGFSYRTLVGNDLVGTDYGYKLHLVYNCTVLPAARGNKTVAKTADPGTKTWTFNNVPPPASTFRPTAHIILDSRLVNPYSLAEIESIMYGRDETIETPAVHAAMPSLEDILSLLGSGITEFIEEFI